MSLDGATARGFEFTQFRFSDYQGAEERTYTVQESSLATERRLWVGPTNAYVDLTGQGEYTLMERAHLDVESVRKLRDALSAWLEEG